MCYFDFVRAFASATAQFYKPQLCRIILVSWNRQVQGSFAVGIWNGWNCLSPLVPIKEGECKRHRSPITENCLGLKEDGCIGIVLSHLWGRGGWNALAYCLELQCFPVITVLAVGQICQSRQCRSPGLQRLLSSLFPWFLIQVSSAVCTNGINYKHKCALQQEAEYPGLSLNNIPKVTFGVLFFAVALINQCAMLLLFCFLTPLLCYS